MGNVCLGPEERELILERRRTAVEVVDKLLFDCCLNEVARQRVTSIIEDFLSQAILTSQFGVLPGVVPKKWRRQ